MTLKQCYEAMGADYDEVVGRLRSERLVQKFVLKFLDDKSFELLRTSYESGNYEEAFRAAHTIKGMCQNLSFTKLGKSSSELTESLRGGVSPNTPALLDCVCADYKETTDAINAFKAELPG